MRVVDRIVHLEVGHRAIDLAPLLGVDGGDLAEAPPRVPLLAIGALGGGSGWEAVGPASPPSGAASSGLPLARAAASSSLRVAIPRLRIFWMPASPFGFPHCVHHASRSGIYTIGHLRGTIRGAGHFRIGPKWGTRGLAHHCDGEVDGGLRLGRHCCKR